MAGPLLAIPILNRPDLLAKCVASIDYPVRLLVIDNSPDGIAADVLADYEGDYFITEPPANLGYSASVNLAIKTHAADPFWLIANADVEFGPGDLARLVDEMHGPRWVGVTDWRLFGLTAEAVDRAGLWDENFHPCYCEDADYERRCDLTGVERYFITGTTSHVGSVSYRSDERYARHNARTYPENLAYYQAKWGGPLRGGERFSTPFDSGADPRSWTLDRQRLAANQWS